MKYAMPILAAALLILAPAALRGEAAGEDDPTGETLAMSAVAIAAGPVSLGMIAYNGYRIRSGRPGTGAGVLGIVAGGLSMIAGLDLRSEGTSFSTPLVVVGALSMIAGWMSIFLDSRGARQETSASLRVYPCIWRPGTTAAWSGMELRWNF